MKLSVCVFLILGISMAHAEEAKEAKTKKENKRIPATTEIRNAQFSEGTTVQSVYMGAGITAYHFSTKEGKNCYGLSNNGEGGGVSISCPQ